MKLENIPITELPNFRGGEKMTRARMYVDELNKIMVNGVLEPGASIGYHTHDSGSEIVYIISGTGKAVYDGGEERLASGDCHYCPKGHAHSIINDGDGPLEFFAVVPNQ